jgi:hypothetical protein
MLLPELENTLGLEHTETRVLEDIQVETRYYRFTSGANRQTVRALLGCVHGTRQLMFFDDQHPSISDSGAFIFVIHPADEWLAQSANHGWSTDWAPVSLIEAQRYMQACIPCNSGTSRSYIAISNRDNPFYNRKIDRSRRSPLRKYLDKRLSRR